MSAIFRPTALRTLRVVRPFSTTRALPKSITETVKDAAQTVNRAASDAALKGIKTGETVAETTKEYAGAATGTAKEYAGAAKGTAEEYAGAAKGTANEYAGAAKGKAQELKGDAKGAAKEAGAL
ncbi:hypothetical protein EDC01DRAFT_638507 [Geopyxis carbonaria]|nr:hypothetical protein EDC01DRAFT_638507 [Geopyxis carbonaria]